MSEPPTTLCSLEPPAPPTRAQQADLARDESRFTDNLRRTRPLAWAATLYGPFAATALLLAVLVVVKGLAWTRRLAIFAVVTFFFAGRFVILGGSASGAAVPDAGVDDVVAPANITSLHLVLMVVWMDLMAAILLVCHAGFLFRIPFLGKRLAALVEDGQFILKSNPWMRRATFWGLVAFVLFPLAATGSVGGAIFGRLLGMSRLATFVGIMLGSILGCLLMYYFAGVINRNLDRDNPWLTIGGVIVIVGLILLLNIRYQQIKKRSRAAPPPA